MKWWHTPAAILLTIITVALMLFVIVLTVWGMNSAFDVMTHTDDNLTSAFWMVMIGLGMVAIIAEIIGGITGLIYIWE